MSCVPVQHRFPKAFDETDDLLSWKGIAAAVREHARPLPPAEREELLNFADLLEGFAQLEKISRT